MIDRKPLCSVQCFEIIESSRPGTYQTSRRECVPMGVHNYHVSVTHYLQQPVDAMHINRIWKAIIGCDKERITGNVLRTCCIVSPGHLTSHWFVDPSRPRHGNCDQHSPSFSRIARYPITETERHAICHP